MRRVKTNEKFDLVLVSHKLIHISPSHKLIRPSTCFTIWPKYAKPVLHISSCCRCISFMMRFFVSQKFGTIKCDVMAPHGSHDYKKYLIFVLVLDYFFVLINSYEDFNIKRKQNNFHPPPPPSLPRGMEGIFGRVACNQTDY